MRTLIDITDSTSTSQVIFYQKGEHEVPEQLKGLNLNELENTYVKVYCSIRVFKEKRAIVGSHIAEIKKHDDITNHLLSIFVASQMRIKGTLDSTDF